MAVKLSEGDTISMTGEVTMIHDDGHVTVRLHGYQMPITSRTKQSKDQSRIEGVPRTATKITSEQQPTNIAELGFPQYPH